VTICEKQNTVRLKCFGTTALMAIPGAKMKGCQRHGMAGFNAAFSWTAWNLAAALAQRLHLGSKSHDEIIIFGVCSSRKVAPVNFAIPLTADASLFQQGDSGSNA
jgi:hypothetical protein